MLLGLRQTACIRILVIIMFFSSTYPVSAVYAQGKGGKPTSAGGTAPTTSGPGPTDEMGGANKSDKLDVTDIEKKYWAAKDTDFSVVQNRTYSKTGRLGLSLAYGVLVNDPYSKGNELSGSLSYYFTERYGLELNYTNIKANDSKSTEFFKNRYGAPPDHGKETGYYGAAFNWVPFYAKMSVLNSQIIYFDMAFSPGMGVTSYNAQVDTGSVAKSSPTLAFDVTQHFFLGRHFAFRVDYKNRWFREEVLHYTGSATRGKVTKTDTTQVSSLLFGTTFFF